MEKRIDWSEDQKTRSNAMRRIFSSKVGRKICQCQSARCAQSGKASQDQPNVLQRNWMGKQWRAFTWPILKQRSEMRELLIAGQNQSNNQRVGSQLWHRPVRWHRIETGGTTPPGLIFRQRSFSRVNHFWERKAPWQSRQKSSQSRNKIRRRCAMAQAECRASSARHFQLIK